MRETVKSTLLGLLKNAGEIVTKIESKCFLAASMSAYVFTTLYITLLYNLIKEKLIFRTLDKSA